MIDYRLEGGGSPRFDSSCVQLINLHGLNPGLNLNASISPIVLGTFIFRSFQGDFV
jgi:hypothetical protein